MTTFLGSYERPRRQPLGETSRIGRLVRLSEDTLTAVVELGNEQFELPVSPGKYVLGANVAVLESKGKPRRVSGPAGVWPEGLDADADAPDTVTAVEQLGPVEFSPEDQAILDQTVADLADAQADLADAFERIGNLATEVGFAWSGHSEEADAYPPGTNFRVDWAALGGGEFRLEMKNIPTGANFGWVITLPQGDTVFPTTNPAIVTATEPGSIYVYAWADDENIGAEFYFEVHPPMLDETGPLQAAISAAAHAAVRASRIAPRSLREPTIEDGENRPIGSIWTLVNAEGEELAYWAWDGTEWVPQALSTQVIPYLDAAHISTGVLDADRINVTEIWGQIATFGKIITEQLIATGAVTAEALNVVHVDPETGYGWRAEPEGLVFLDRDGAPMITLRTDMANAFTVMKDGIPVATISPDGDVTGVNLVAHESFRYRGQELADRLDQQPRGEITASNLSEPLPIGPEWARVGHVTWTSDSGSRRYKATLSLATNNGTATRVQVSARRSTGNTVESTNSLLQIFEHGDGRERNTRVHEFDFNSALTDEQSVGFFVRCADGGTVTAMASNEGGATTKVTLADTGRAITEEPYIGYSPPIPGGGGGSGSDDAPAKSQHSKTFTATSFRTYSRTGLTHTRASQSVVHGAIAGSDSRGHWIWNIAAIRSALSGATNITGKLVIPVEHTYHGDGTDFVIKKHNYTSLPSTFGTAREWQTVRGKRQTEIVIPLDTTTLNQLQGVGTATAGFSADPGAGTGVRNYGYMSRYARLEFDYRK